MQMSRTQIPLRLCWAMTIHKAQGKTLDDVVIDLGDKEFAANLTYTALSRVRRLDGMAFERFPNYERFLSMSKSSAILRQVKWEEQLNRRHQHTMAKYGQAIADFTWE